MHKTLHRSPVGVGVPPGKGGPPAGSESCVGGERSPTAKRRQPVSRPCIEPRKALFVVGADAVDLAEGRIGGCVLGLHPSARPGSKTMACPPWGCPGTWEARSSPRSMTPEVGNRPKKAQRPAAGVTCCGRTRQRDNGTQAAAVAPPSEGNEARRDGRSGVRSARSTDEVGEPAPRGPGGGKGPTPH